MSGTRALLFFLLPLLAISLWSVPGSARAQTVTDEDVFDPPGLGTGPYSEMATLMEVTIFRIDVLTLTVRVPSEVGERLRELTEGERYSEELADTVAAVILSTDDLWARQVFERDASLERVLNGMRETSASALEEGYISRAHHERFVESLPETFDFLEGRGVEEGDEIVLRIRGDTVRNLYRTASGLVLMDRSVVDAEARRGSVPSFYAPGTPFREGLVKSLSPARSAPR